jgi:hypothetical protein
VSEIIKLSVKTVIGTGDPFDAIMLIPLICDWRVPQNCLMALQGEKCDATIRRLYVLETPIEGHGVLGICEAHHQALQPERAVQGETA